MKKGNKLKPKESRKQEDIECQAGEHYETQQDLGNLNVESYIAMDLGGLESINKTCDFVIQYLKNASFSFVIEDWADEIDLDISVKPKFKYLAVNSDGRWEAFFKKPIKSDTFWCVNDYTLSVYLSDENYPKNFSGSWEDSLHKIVDGRLIRVKNKI